jgi:acyl dehydratase
METSFWFDDIQIGRVHLFGAATIDLDEILDFHFRFAPHLPQQMASAGLDPAKGPPAAQAHIYAIWSRLLWEECRDWPILTRLGQDALRWYKTAHAGDVLSVRLTFMSRDDLAADRGMIVVQHDVLNQHGELVMSLLTRTVMAKKAAA